MNAALSGRSVVVTGASSGIGFEIARRIRDEDARVHAADYGFGRPKQKAIRA
ncbi:SDR family NAD(P)-dependent oxidoreductase [Kitasatospora cinereorecta]|uniref:SDR family NAD(P)-dependent oxidoreductase n=1 Tax=Kitasatospora cinereorecta TaxID=285560 RepID=A0ABW0V4P3_9ACTN